MAWRHRLTLRLTLHPAAIIAAGVLLAHLALLQWLQFRLGPPSALQAMSEPMVTRVLMPQDADPPAPAPADPAPPPVAVSAGGQLEAVAVVPTGVGPAASRPAGSASSPASSPIAPAPAAATPEAVADRSTGPASSPMPDPTTSASGAPPRAAAPAVEPAAAPAPAASAASSPSRTPGLDWPPDTLVRYQLEGEWRGGAVPGSAQVQWQRQDGRYQARILVDLGLLGNLVLTSQGELAGAHLVPRVYEEQRRNRRRLVRMPDEAVVLADGRQVERPVQVQDTASQFIELGQRLARSVPPARVGQTLQLPLARPGGVDVWSYDIVAEEIVNLPKAGEVSALRLRPRRPGPAADNSVTAEIWFAPRLQYLPVRILLTLGTEARIDLRVESIEQR